MSPELNSNPPVLIKRKKKQRDKKHASASKINDFSNSSYNYLQGNLNSYPNIALNDTYYPFPTYSLPAEPMSLPIYPPTYHNVNVPMTLTYKTTVPNKPYKIPTNDDRNDYTSLPVVNGDHSDAGQRRNSDPGLLHESDSSCNSQDGRIVQSLTHQVEFLKESNRKLSREVAELRMEMNALKQHQHSRHYERDYEPGMISDMIREIRDAARVREDALLAKVKHMVEEKQFGLHQYHIASEKNRNNERLSKLEEQMKTLSLSAPRSEDSAPLPSTSDDRQVFELEREALLLRRELQDVKAKKEESEQKVMQLDKRLSNLLRPKNPTPSETSDDGSKNSTSTADTVSVTTQSSILSVTPHRITLSGPVTDL